ncbi:MAG: hypothetical protein GC138_02475 [Gammaproteobacteria bacterium]|nr:hypothetical protein [Gammaproteobacteria bacterium]
MRIHPLTCILSFLLFSTSLALNPLSFSTLGAGFLLLAFGYLLAGVGHLSAAWHRIRRLRWFFLSIALFYFWATPGIGLFSVQGEDVPWWMPTLSGIQAGCYRALVLVAIMMGANLVLGYLDRGQIVSAISRLLRPLGWLGFPHERFSVRVSLTLDALTSVQLLADHELANRDRGAHPLMQMGRVSARVFHDVMLHSNTAPCRAVEIHPLAPMPVWQWGLPIAVAILFRVI